MKNILLRDLLGFTDEELSRTKVKFNQSNGEDEPIDVYLVDPDTVNNQWLFWRTKRSYFRDGEIAICLVKMSYDTWLLTTIKTITETLNVSGGVNYKGVEVEKAKPYFGRVIVKYHKTAQSQVRWFETLMDELVVQQILPTAFDGWDFPGYDKVNISYHQLESILNHGKRDWIAALENQKAVYLITDNHTGKMYVGSATGSSGMLLQRWSNYIQNGHGGNKELLKISNEKGFDYIKTNFKYSILENYNSKIDDHVVLARESWWKDTLQTRKFGYNHN